MAPLGLLIPGSTATQLRGRRPQRSELPGPGAVLLCPRGPEEVRRGLSLNSKAPMAAPGPAQGSVPLPAAASLGRGQATHPALIRDNRPPTGARFPQGFAPRDLPGLPWHNSEGCQGFRGQTERVPELSTPAAVPPLLWPGTFAPARALLECLALSFPRATACVPRSLQAPLSTPAFAKHQILPNFFKVGPTCFSLLLL